MSSRGPQKVRLKPRISAPKLGEYVGVGARRRRQILRDQKFPPDFMVTRYKPATDAIRLALLSSASDVETRLRTRAQHLASLPAGTKYEASANHCCSQALRRFARIYPNLPLAGARPALARKEGFPIKLEGVDVSVWPTVLLSRTARDGSVEMGALLLIFRKTESLTDEGGHVVAELLRKALVQSGLPNVKPKLCIVVDVFSRNVFTAPARSQRLSQELEWACREIAVLWGDIAA